MQALPFDKPGRFYKGNIHTHSTLSDGRLTPEEVVTEYASRGYDFISVTDHFLPNDRFRKNARGFCKVADTASLDRQGFVTIPGAEIHGPGMDNGELWHLVAAGLPLNFTPWRAEETGAAIAARAREAGAFVAIAHPAWNGLSIDDAETLVQSAHAVEVYNHGCQVEVDRGESWHFTDVLLGRGRRLTAVATDDAHVILPREPETPGDAFGGWIHVRAQSLDAESLVAALKAGHFYASMGPHLHDVWVEGDGIAVESSPVETIVVSGKGSRLIRKHGNPITELRESIEQFQDGGFCRVTVIDAAGRRAWTNPIWLEPRLDTIS